MRAENALPATVVILPRDDDGVEAVVAPKSVLERLAKLARPSPPGAVISSSEYSVTVDDGTARVTARYTVHILDDSTSTALLPLSDVRLESVRVDGAPAFPSVARPGVYAVPLPGPGRYEIEINSVASVTKTGTERELRFGIPECPYTHIVADLPSSARQQQLIGRVGQQLMVDGDRFKHMESDAGVMKAIHYRWREGVGSAAAAVKQREAYVWDVSEKGAELTACYLTRIEQGTVLVPPLRTAPRPGRG